MRRKLPPWKLVVPKNAVSPTDSIYKKFDIVIQSCCLEHITGSDVHYSRGPFTLRWRLPSGKIVEKSAKLRD
jgi:hypothetical protein